MDPVACRNVVHSLWRQYHDRSDGFLSGMLRAYWLVLLVLLKYDYRLRRRPKFHVLLRRDWSVFFLLSILPHLDLWICIDDMFRSVRVKLVDRWPFVPYPFFDFCFVMMVFMYFVNR